jgi:hypothetical protein
MDHLTGQTRDRVRRSGRRERWGGAGRALGDRHREAGRPTQPRFVMLRAQEPSQHTGVGRRQADPAAEPGGYRQQTATVHGAVEGADLLCDLRQPEGEPFRVDGVRRSTPHRAQKVVPGQRAERGHLLHPVPRLVGELEGVGKPGRHSFVRRLRQAQERRRRYRASPVPDPFEDTERPIEVGG